jgi:hypothetical protein
MVVKKTVKKRDILGIYNCLEMIKIDGEKVPVKYAYFIAKTKSLIDSEVKALKTVITPSPMFMEYDKKRFDIINKYVEKDENDEPVFINNATYKIKPQYVDTLNSEIDVLQNEYEDVISNNSKLQAEINELLSEQVEVDLFKIRFDDLPSKIDQFIMNMVLKYDLLIEEEQQTEILPEK